MVDTPRRQEGLQRVQIGLTGLAGVVLLVGLANIVIEKARVDDAALAPPVTTTLETNALAPKEPLAELGVQPAPEQAPIVPDLQPDPNLKKPMDRDPAQPLDRDPAQQPN
ncbi:MAG: hypothetical protein U9R77_08360 [Pseudomonadota bacterium]|uniref:hypothetical protein n=1 Tax=Sphingobium naphthae TaxID=1886786 RepID=UPI002B071BBB|nr:hypothetical protein [Pseudomonadota bacterium]